MSVGAVFAGGGGVSEPTGLNQQMKVLQKAIAAGDTWEAQQALAAFQKDLPGVPQPAVVQSVSLSDPGQTMKADLQSLQNALEAGDIAGAQSAFAQFKQHLQVAQREAAPSSQQSDSQTKTKSGMDDYKDSVSLTVNAENSTYSRQNRVDVFA